MDPKIQEACELLEAVIHVLDQAAQALDSINETQFAAEVVGESQNLAVHAQHLLQAAYPELTPSYAVDESDLAEEWREYGRRLVVTRDMWSNGQYQEMLDVWRDFLAQRPPNFFVHLTDRLLKHLEKVVSEKTHPDPA